MSYTAQEIEDMRNIIQTLYLSYNPNQPLSIYERMDITEKMLNTYISQSIKYSDLQVIFSKQLDKERKEKEND